MANSIKLKRPTAEQAWELIDQYADIFEMASLVPGAGNILLRLVKLLAKRAEKTSWTRNWKFAKKLKTRSSTS